MDYIGSLVPGHQTYCFRWVLIHISRHIYLSYDIIRWKAKYELGFRSLVQFRLTPYPLTIEKSVRPRIFHMYLVWIHYLVSTPRWEHGYCSFMNRSKLYNKYLFLSSAKHWMQEFLFFLSNKGNVWGCNYSNGLDFVDGKVENASAHIFHIPQMSGVQGCIFWQELQRKAVLWPHLGPSRVIKILYSTFWFLLHQLNN